MTDSPAYFPDDTLEERYGPMLARLEECSLYAQQLPPGQKICRFLQVLNFSRGEDMVRVGPHPERNTGILKRWRNGCEEQSLTLLEQHWRELETLVESADFWSFPTTDPDDLGIDPYFWILEVRNGKRYHVAMRLGPGNDTPFLALCNWFIRLAERSDD